VNIKTTLKTSVAAAALFAVAAPMSTPAKAADDTLSSGNKNKLQISGYVAKSLWYADDGAESQLFITDGSTSRSRVRWVATGTLNENVTAGATIEMDIPLSNAQANARMTSNAGETSGTTQTDLSSWAIRHQYVWVNHKKFGKLTLGNTDPSGNGYAEALLSGTTAIDLSSAKPFCASCTFVEDIAGVKTRTAFSTGNHTNFDGLSRTDVLKYDTPTFMGFSASGSYVGDGTTEWGVKYAGKFGPVAVDARFLYDAIESGAGNYTNQIAGSIAALHDSGINASFAAGKGSLKNGVSANNVVTGSPKFWYASVGYKAKIFKVGGTNFNVHYQVTEQGFLTLRDAENTTWGVTALQEFDAIGANIGIFYKRYELDGKVAGTGVDRTFEDIDVFGLQTVFNF
jgi:predicted porin